MAEEIDSLFVRLGLETDQQQFREANSMFRGLRTRALQFGAAIGTGLGMNQLTFGFARSREALQRFSDQFGVSAEFVDALGFAFGQVGGQAEDAFSLVRRLADIIESTDWGELNAAAFREIGFDPMLIQNAEGIADAVSILSDATQGMQPEQIRRAFGNLGLTEADITLLSGRGSESPMSLIGEGLDLARVSGEMTQASIDFNQATGRFSRTIQGFTDRISTELLSGDLTDAINNLADWLARNQDALIDGFKEWTPILKDVATGVGVLAAYQIARAGLGVLSQIPGAQALTVGGIALASMAAREGARINPVNPMTQFDVPSATVVSDFDLRRQTERGMPGREGAMVGIPGGMRMGQVNNIEVNLSGVSMMSREQMREAVYDGIGRAVRQMSDNTRDDFGADVQ